MRVRSHVVLGAVGAAFIVIAGAAAVTGGRGVSRQGSYCAGTSTSCGTGAVLLTIEDGFRARGVNVKEYGATGDGSTDDTAAVQAAITASYGKRLYFPSGTFLASSLTVTGSIQLFGEGTIKQIASTSGDLLAISGTSTVVRISGLAFDGNEPNQAVDTTNRTINFTAVGTSSTPAGLEVVNCAFINGSYSDIRISTDGLLSTDEWVRISGSTFLAGREGEIQAYDPRYVDLASPVEYVISHNLFNRLSTPTNFGRAGIVAHDGTGTGAEGRGSITGNTFVQVGRSQLNSSLAAIDLYSRQNGVTVEGNSITTPYGRGIDVKADSEAITITGNTINGLSGGSDGTMSAQIVLNQGTINGVANGPFTISGNTLLNSGNDGISIDARDSGGTQYAHGILVIGNTVTSATRRGIGVAAASEVSITGNNVAGGSPAIFVDATTTAIHVTGNHLTPTTNGVQISSGNTTAFLDIAVNTSSGGARGVIVQSGAGGAISGNIVKGPGTSAVDIAGTTGAFRVAGNVSDATTPFVNSGTNTALHVQQNDWTIGTTAHTLTISSGVVTATMDWHYIDGAAPDTLTTINGGYDGQILTLRPLTAAHVITVQNGTNLRLNQKDFVMDDPKDSITLRWANDAWIEMSRSNNGATNFDFPTLPRAPVTFTGKTADLAAQNLTPSATAGDYRVCVTARTTTSGSGTTATLNILWTDEGGAKTDAVGTWALNSVTVTGQINKCEFIHAAASTAIQYSVTGGTYGTSVYAISGTAERLN